MSGYNGGWRSQTAIGFMQILAKMRFQEMQTGAEMYNLKRLSVEQKLKRIQKKNKDITIN